MQQRDDKVKKYESPTHPSDQFDNAFDYIEDGEFGHVKDAFKMRNAWNIKHQKVIQHITLTPFLFQNKYFACYMAWYYRYR